LRARPAHPAEQAHVPRRPRRRRALHLPPRPARLRRTAHPRPAPGRLPRPLDPPTRRRAGQARRALDPELDEAAAFTIGLHALVRIAQVASQIAALYERYGPDEPWGFADPSGWKCSPRYCGHYGRCPGGGGL